MGKRSKATDGEATALSRALGVRRPRASPASRPVVCIAPDDFHFEATGEPGELLGRMRIAGVDFHVCGWRVKQMDGVQVGATEHADARLAEVYGVYESRLQTVSIPGHKGEWVVVIHPHGD